MPSNVRDVQDAARKDEVGTCEIARRRQSQSARLYNGEPKANSGEARRTEDAQDHCRELPLPVRIVIVLHREQKRRKTGAEAADCDEDVRRHARGEEGDDELRPDGSAMAGRA